MSTRAERLGVTEGVVWVIGDSDEENALLDPLPDCVETIAEREDADDDIAAAVIVIDDVETIGDVLDDALPQVGSVPAVWIAVSREVDLDAVTSGVADYGWQPSRRETLAGTWTAIRIDPN